MTSTVVTSWPYSASVLSGIRSSNGGSMAFSVFISHSSKDVDLIETLRPAAEVAGVSLYLAEHDSHPGECLATKVQNAIDASAVVVVLLTPNSFDSAYVQQEIGYALHARKPIIPIVGTSVAQESLAMLAGVEYVPLDVAHPDRCAAAIQVELIARVAIHRQKEQMELFVAAAILAIAVLAVSKGN